MLMYNIKYSYICSQHIIFCYYILVNNVHNINSQKINYVYKINNLLLLLYYSIVILLFFNKK